MPMREECKHYQSRTYASGEVARLCVLDLAPEAPWRCPDNCASYVRRLADAGWTHGSLVEPAIEDEPEVPGESGAEIAALLDEAESVVDAIAIETRDEVWKEEHPRSSLGRTLGRLGLGRRPRRDTGGFGDDPGRGKGSRP